VNLKLYGNNSKSVENLRFTEEGGDIVGNVRALISYYFEPLGWDTNMIEIEDDIWLSDKRLAKMRVSKKFFNKYFMKI
jgi:hypothetical protein